MTSQADGGGSAEDREVLRLARARLMRICRLDGAGADRSLARGAEEQKVALVSIAMRVLAASNEDLAAGRVVPTGRPSQLGRPAGGPHQRPRAGHQQQRPQHGKPRKPGQGQQRPHGKQQRRGKR